MSEPLLLYEEISFIIIWIIIIHTSKLCSPLVKSFRSCNATNKPSLPLLLPMQTNVLASFLFLGQYIGLLPRHGWHIYAMFFTTTLQELKLQGIKVRDGVVFSRYSLDQCFAINLSDFTKHWASDLQCRTCNQQVPGLKTGLGNHLA